MTYYAILKPILTPAPRQVSVPDQFVVTFRPVGHTQARDAQHALERAKAAGIPCPIIEPLQENPQ